MNKPFLYFILSFCFFITVQAQEKRVEKDLEKYEFEAQKDSAAIADFLQLDDVSKSNVYNILLYKEKNLPDILNLPERMKIFSANITNKLQKALSGEQFIKLKENEALYAKALN